MPALCDRVSMHIGNLCDSLQCTSLCVHVCVCESVYVCVCVCVCVCVWYFAHC